jgi:phosphotransacetylase
MHSAHHPRLSQIIAEERTSVPLGVVYPCDAVSLSAAHQVSSLGLAKVLLLGPSARIKAVAQQESIDLSSMTLMDTPEDPKLCAKEATLAVRRGELSVIMKGSLHTDELMAAVVNKEYGLRTERRVSHVMVCDIPAYHKLLSLTDCVVNLAPNALQKRDILIDAIRFLHTLGIAQPKVAIVAAVESVNPAMPATLDAAELVKLAAAGSFPRSVVEGPFGFDNAVSLESARIKGIQSTVSGDPDLLLLPDLEAANILYKSLVYMAGGACAGTITGATVPIVLTSRADSVFSRLASVAVSIRSARNQLRIN